MLLCKNGQVAFMLQEEDIRYILMLDFATQKKLLEPLMRDPRNKVCADCSAIAPTWVSLDFGVFLCSNCSGSHRGLGPTITRVRSANLDKWERQWVENMRVGNTDLNKYWEADPEALSRKPNPDSSLQEISRYVFLKYIKKKFVVDHSKPDPLTAYKNGNVEPASKEPESKPVQPAPKAQPKPIAAPVAPVVQKPKQEVSLLDFDMDPPQQLVQVPTQSSNTPAPADDEDEFTDFSEAGSAAPTDPVTIPVASSAPSDGFMSFDALMNSQKQQQQQQPQVNAFHGHYQQQPQQNHFMGQHQQHNYAYPQHNRHGSYTPQYPQHHQQPQQGYYNQQQQGVGYGQPMGHYGW